MLMFRWRLLFRVQPSDILNNRQMYILKNEGIIRGKQTWIHLILFTETFHSEILQIRRRGQPQSLMIRPLGTINVNNYMATGGGAIRLARQQTQQPCCKPDILTTHMRKCTQSPGGNVAEHHSFPSPPPL